MNGEHEGSPQTGYGSPDDQDGLAVFVRVCPICGRFVKADKEAMFDGQGQPRGDNATCRRDGRVQMPFIGYP